MNGITFGNYHSYSDLGLILTSKTIGTPTPKIETIDLPGGDGVLDLTEFFGEVKYGNRKLSFDFATVVPKAQFLSHFTAVQNALHGKKMRIILDDDPLSYYMGRITVNEWKADKNIGKFTVDCDCEPFKYALDETVISHTVSGTKAIILINGRKRAVPEVAVSGSIKITYQGNVWSLGSGSFTLPELELVQGANALTLDGTGTVTFTWQEGDL